MADECAHRPGKVVTEEQGGVIKRAGKLYLSLPVPESTIINTIMTSRLFNKVLLFGASHFIFKILFISRGRGREGETY